MTTLSITECYSVNSVTNLRIQCLVEITVNE